MKKRGLRQQNRPYRGRHESLFSKTQLLITVLWVGLLLGCLPFSVFAQTPEAGGEKSEPVVLHNLGNEELLKQAKGIFKKASNEYLAQMRGLAQSELLRDRASQAVLDFTLSERKEAPSEEISPLEKAKLEAERAKTRLDDFQRKMALVKAEKTRLNQYIEQIEPARSAIKHFLGALNELDLPLFEIGLRLNDGFLKPDMVPGFLNEASLDAWRETLLTEQDRLKRESETASGKLKAIADRVKAAKGTVIEFKSLHTAAEKKYARELSRQSVEQEYVKKSPEELLVDLSELQEELIWLNGAFNLSFGRFSENQNRAAMLQEEIDGMNAPETRELLHITGARAEEMEQIAKKEEKLAAFHGDRIKKLREVRSEWQSVIRQSETFQGDATVLMGHYFRMRVIAKLLDDFVKEGKLELEKIPEYNRLDALVDSNEDASAQTARVLSTAQKANEQLNQIVGEIQKSESTRADIEERLRQMKKTSEAARQAQQWNAALKDLTAKQIVQRFEDNSKKIYDNRVKLDKAKEAYEKGREAVEEARKKFDSLKDPLLLSAREESAREKRLITEKLYELAGLDLPAGKKEKGEEAPAALSSPGSETADLGKKQYQNLLSTRIRIVTGREKSRAELIDDLKAMKGLLDEYAAVLNEADKLALQHYANAVELKKRLGRRQLQAHEVPYGITDGLKRDRIDELEAEIALVANQLVQTPQQIESLGAVDESGRKIQTLTTQTLDLVGKRLDILQDVKKLEQRLEVKRAALSESELKSLKQAASRRLEAEESLQEHLVSFVPSEGTENLTDLLKSHFLELTLLEGKQRNLKSQKREFERLIRLAEEEKAGIVALLPLFHGQVDQLESREKEEWAKVRIRFAPEKAEEILGKFEEKRGRRFSIPTPVEKGKEAALIEKLTPALFEHHVQSMAVRNWITLFEQRLSPIPTGLSMEIGDYQAKVGEADARSASLQRRVNYLLGHPEDQLPEPGPDEAPMTEMEKRHFLEGEISMLREERYDIRTRTAIFVVVKLVVILLLTFLITMLINRVAGRAIRREEEKSEGAAQNIMVKSLLRAVSKLVVWIFAVIISLHYVGFNVGAILAGLGIFGFAIAMASKEMIGNFIGGINILLAKPFKVGDYVHFDGRWCRIEKIGLQYTNMRQFRTNFLIIAPNSKLTDAPLINTNSDSRLMRHQMDVPLSRRNSFEKIELAMKIITEIINDYPETKMKQVYPKSFNEHAYVLNLRYDIRHIHGEIIKRFEEHGIELAVSEQFIREVPKGEIDG